MNAEEFQWIQFDATAVEVEELLIAKFFVWEHVSGNKDISTESLLSAIPHSRARRIHPLLVPDCGPEISSVGVLVLENSQNALVEVGGQTSAGSPYSQSRIPVIVTST